MSRLHTREQIATLKNGSHILRKSWRITFRSYNWKCILAYHVIIQLQPKIHNYNFINKIYFPPTLSPKAHHVPVAALQCLDASWFRFNLWKLWLVVSMRFSLVSVDEWLTTWVNAHRGSTGSCYFEVSSMGAHSYLIHRCTVLSRNDWLATRASGHHGCLIQRSGLLRQHDAVASL